LLAGIYGMNFRHPRVPAQRLAVAPGSGQRPRAPGRPRGRPWPLERPVIHAGAERAFDALGVGPHVGSPEGSHWDLLADGPHRGAAAVAGVSRGGRYRTACACCPRRPDVRCYSA
jgi:hypothetical protein